MIYKVKEQKKKNRSTRVFPCVCVAATWQEEEERVIKVRHHPVRVQQTVKSEVTVMLSENKFKLVLIFSTFCNVPSRFIIV